MICPVADRRVGIVKYLGQEEERMRWMMMDSRVIKI